MPRRPKPVNHYYRGADSDHFRDGLFFNPDGEAPRGLADLLRWRFGGKRRKWPVSWPSPFSPAKPEGRLDGNALRVTMVGHASVLIQTSALNILTDPVWSDRVSPFSFVGPKRVNPPGIAFEDLPQVDLVLVSHNHYDHLDQATLARLADVHRPTILTLLGNDAIIAASAPGASVRAHDWGERIPIANGVVVHVEPAHHWSARGTRDRRMALWGGFVIETPAGKILFAGDTGFHGGRHYRALAERHRALRLAILPIGSYEPRWFMEPQHQNPEEAVEGMLLANAAFAAGCHWGTFPLTDEAIDEPRDRLAAALASKGIDGKRFRAMLPGEVWDVPLAEPV
jgi:L-ascorbate metabolism protein UlaG (beta-lactamase superfamily)